MLFPIRLVLLLPITTWLAAGQSGSESVVISQVYGGGGNSGAALRNDFIELFNRGTTPVNISGWSVQYAPASGSSWDATTLSGMLQPGQYYLVSEGAGSGGTAALPTADATGAIALSATAGKVALVRNSVALTGSVPSTTQIQDLVGYGSSSAAEGRSGPELSSTTALLRKGSGCTDTNDNFGDFTVASPAPRNSRTALHACSSTGAPSSAPLISAAGVVHAASFRAGAIAPGEIVTIFGSAMGPVQLMTLQVSADQQHITSSLAGTRVLFDGIPAPLVYTSATEVSAIAPFALAGRGAAQLQVEYNGQMSAAVPLTVAANALGMFTANSSGKGQTAILNEDNSINDTAHPAQKGSVITVYGTGAGQTLPPGEDGRIVGVDVLPRTAQTLTATIAGLEAEVLYAGGAPGLVSGVLQVNIRVPESVPFGGAVPLALTIGSSQTPAGVFVTIDGPPQPSGTGALIDQQLEKLRTDPSTTALPQISSDTAALPANWLGLVSWNIQVGGTAPTSTTRPPLVQSTLAKLFGGTYQLLAAQEIPNRDSAEFLRSSLLPGGAAAWKMSFFDTDDAMDNGYWFRNDVILRDAFPLFVSAQEDSSGRPVANSALAEHPPQVAQFEVGDFDFTLITVHLTFADGNTAESAREMRNVLNYLDWYFQQPDHDPDVMVCGDFNTPSTLSGQKGRSGITLDTVIGQDSRFQSGERRFAVTVHQPTSRSSVSSGGEAVNNYDHCVISADLTEEFLQARRVSTNILTDHASDPEQYLTSDHFPIVSLFRTRGIGVSLDNKRAIRLPATIQ